MAELQVALREFRDELTRQIDKRQASPLLSATIADPPDTWARTVLVQIGTQLAMATYRGRVPVVGEQVEVQRTGAGYKVIVNVPPASSGGLFGSSLNPPAASPNTGYIHTLGFWGHSWIDTTYGTNDALSGYQIANRLFSALGISWPNGRNYGLGGSVITQDWQRMFRTARPGTNNSGDFSWQSKLYPTCFLYGTNDVLRNGDPTFENSRFLNDWTNTWRGVFSYFRAGAIHTPDWLYGGGFSGDRIGDGHYDGDNLVFPQGKAGVTYGGTWTVLDSSSVYASIGATARKTTVSGSTVAIRLPPLFPGTPVTLYFGAEVGQTGSTSATVTHGGATPASPVSLVTNDRVRTPATIQGGSNIRSLYPVRIVGIPKGDGVTSQTITVNAGTLAAGHQLVFMGWSIESQHPPVLVACNVSPSQSLAQPAYNTLGVPGNTNGSVLQWPSYPQSNGPPGGPTTQTAASGATAWNNGVRNTVQAQDLWCRNYYNPALAAVAAEFAPAGSVIIADIATAVDGSLLTTTDLWGPGDMVHLSHEGKALVVNTILTAINRLPIDPRHLIAPVDANWAAEAFTMLARGKSL